MQKNIQAAQAAIDAHLEIAGQVNDPKERIQFLLTDLRHYAHANRINFTAVERASNDQYRDERRIDKEGRA